MLELQKEKRRLLMLDSEPEEARTPKRTPKTPRTGDVASPTGDVASRTSDVVACPSSPDDSPGDSRPGTGRFASMPPMRQPSTDSDD